jgi:hypothetical protein
MDLVVTQLEINHLSLAPLPVEVLPVEIEEGVGILGNSVVNE